MNVVAFVSMCCHCLGTTDGCVVSVRQFGFRRRSTTFICILAIQMSKVYTIRDKKLNQWSSVCYRTKIKGIIITIVISNV